MDGWLHEAGMSIFLVVPGSRGELECAKARKGNQPPQAEKRRRRDAVSVEGRPCELRVYCSRVSLNCQIHQAYRRDPSVNMANVNLGLRGVWSRADAFPRRANGGRLVGG